jgi:hypothetical protein
MFYLIISIAHSVINYSVKATAYIGFVCTSILDPPANRLRDVSVMYRHVLRRSSDSEHR